MYELKKGDYRLVSEETLRKYRLVAEVEGVLIIPIEPRSRRLFFVKKGNAVVKPTRDKP